MSEAVAETLKAIVRERGEELASDVRRLEGLLRDLHPEDPGEVAALVEAAARGIAADALARRDEPWRESAIEAAVAQLTELSGLAVKPARWAVSAWLAALGVAGRGAGRRRAPRSRVAEREGTLQDVLSGG